MVREGEKKGAADQDDAFHCKTKAEESSKKKRGKKREGRKQYAWRIIEM